MMSSKSGTSAAGPHNNAEIDIQTLVRAMWKKRLFVATCTGACLLLAILYLHIATFTYTAQLQVTPAQTSANAGLLKQLGGLKGIASFAGIDLPTDQETSAFQLYIESLRSREVAEKLSQRTDLMQVIFSTEWNAKIRHWSNPAGRFAPIKNAIRRLLGFPVYAWQPPGSARLQEYLTNAIAVDQTRKSPVVTIHINHKDPIFAVTLLQALHEATDERLRRKAMNRADEYIRYLSKQLQSVTVTEHRLALAQALSEQEKTRMMTSSTLAYAAEPFGAPTASAHPTSPRPLMILIGGCLAGILVGMLSAVLLSLRTTVD